MKYSREIVKAILIGIVIFAILQGVNIVITRSLPSLLSLKWNFIFTMLYSVVLYFANALIFIQLFFDKTIIIIENSLSFNRVKDLIQTRWWNIF